ncbi:DUF2125 domain-containing protein [Brevundimonas lenta]|uniref:DUF2125 domain-containing protein n=1 Tax=Brevundimonas lenta TaxID=424796 RepID=A0A7W6NP38_9CAUL|nr:DUF2125 domain-containing protein [Brevundimonas lenta]MBB4081797.1 hypothetical protein [Brevundimonas lenta]
MSEPAYRHRRRGLFTPFVIVGLVLAVWTGWWFFLAGQIEKQLDLQVAAMRRDGWQITHADVVTTGWPFRARVSVPHADVVAPSGHGIAAPEFVAEANAWNPGRWVVLAPQGVTFTRPDKGKVGIRGDAMRLSISHLRDRFPDFRVQMVRPVFTSHRDAEPFPISSAERIELYTRPHLTNGQQSTDQMDVLFRLVDARGRPGGPVEGATRQGRLSVDVEGVVDRASQLSEGGEDGILANWSRQGGRVTNIQGTLTAGESRARMTSSALSAGPDGRLVGAVALTAEQPLAAIQGLAGSRTGAVNRVGAASAAAATAVRGDREMDLVIRFRDGRTWLGPFALAPAPKLF